MVQKQNFKQETKPMQGTVLESKSEEAQLEKLLQRSHSNVSSFSESVTKEELEFLVETGCKINERINNQKRTLDGIKEIFKETAEVKKQRTFLGKKFGKASVSDKSARSIDPTGFVKYLKKIGQQKLFNNFVSVRLTDAIKSFGEEALGKTISTETKEYYQCSFKR